LEKLEVMISQRGEDAAALGALLMVREKVLAARCAQVDGGSPVTQKSAA
jgi:hypothetical protein